MPITLSPKEIAELPRSERVTKNTVQWTDKRARLQFAPPGTTVYLLPEEEEHADEWGALEPAGVTEDEVAERQVPGSVLTGVAPETSDEEMIAWVTTAKVSDVETYLQSNPGEYQRVLDAETIARGDKGPRPMVVKACELAAQHTPR